MSSRLNAVRYQGLRNLGTNTRKVGKDLEVLMDYTPQCDYRSHSVSSIIHRGILYEWR